MKFSGSARARWHYGCMTTRFTHCCLLGGCTNIRVNINIKNNQYRKKEMKSFNNSASLLSENTYIFKR